MADLSTHVDTSPGLMARWYVLNCAENVDIYTLSAGVCGGGGVSIGWRVVSIGTVEH